MNEENKTLGALIDTRPTEQIAREDIRAEEVIASAVAVDWKEIAPENIRTFGVQDQHGKSDCVAETRRKIKRVLFKVNKGIDLDFSSAAFYRKRSNYPGQGMIAKDAIDLDANVGMTLDVLVPSDALTTEGAANDLSPEKYNDEISKVFAVQGGEIVFTPGDLETVAGTIQKTRKAVMVWFYATVSEWAQLVPTIKTELSGPSDPRSNVVHSVSAIEPAIYQGKKGLWIDDSAHFGGLSRRFITEEFFKARNWFASYPIAFKFEENDAERILNYTIFSNDMEFSAEYITSADVEDLQNCLRSLGLFPANAYATGYFGALTLAAVKKFQIKYGIAKEGDVGFGRVGPKTRAKLNELFA